MDIDYLSEDKDSSLARRQKKKIVSKDNIKKFLDSKKHHGH